MRMKTGVSAGVFHLWEHPRAGTVERDRNTPAPSDPLPSIAVTPGRGIGK
jgi:hypothetical protein